MADETLLEKTAKVVGFGMAMAEDIAVTVKEKVGDAVTTVTGVVTTSPAKKASEKKAARNPAAKKAPAKKMIKKTLTQKAPAKKAATKTVAKKSAVKKTVKRATPKKAAKKFTLKKTAKKSLKQAAKRR
jgi:hypothetical protein